MIVGQMTRIPPEGLIGMVVTSRAGRDAGECYVVIADAGGEMVLVADGKRRPADRPKRKNVKHLIVRGPAGPVSDRLRAGMDISDQELRSVLATPLEGS